MRGSSETLGQNFESLLNELLRLERTHDNFEAGSLKRVQAPGPEMRVPSCRPLRKAVVSAPLVATFLMQIRAFSDAQERGRQMGGQLDTWPSNEDGL